VKLRRLPLAREQCQVSLTYKGAKIIAIGRGALFCSCVSANVHDLWHEDEVVTDFEIEGAHSPTRKIVRITVLRKAKVARKCHRHAKDVAAL
jgi:hypothetical protein